MIKFGDTGTKHSKPPRFAAIGDCGWSPPQPWRQTNSKGAPRSERPTAQAGGQAVASNITGHAPAWPAPRNFAAGHLAMHSTDMIVFGYGFGESGALSNSTWRQNLAKSATQFCPCRQCNYLKRFMYVASPAFKDSSTVVSTFGNTLGSQRRRRFNRLVPPLSVRACRLSIKMHMLLVGRWRPPVTL